ncbi:MAG: hypothetical protein U5L11_16395 [Arhodomonas sp.]|nr:hypothetical protein [Arhodomonas sp.]
MIPLTFHLLAARPAGSRPAPARLGEPGTEHNSWEVYDHSGRNIYAGDRQRPEGTGRDPEGGESNTSPKPATSTGRPTGCRNASRMPSWRTWKGW